MENDPVVVSSTDSPEKGVTEWRRSDSTGPYAFSRRPPWTVHSYQLSLSPLLPKI